MTAWIIATYCIQEDAFCIDNSHIYYLKNDNLAFVIHRITKQFSDINNSISTWSSTFDSFYFKGIRWIFSVDSFAPIRILLHKKIHTDIS